MHLFSRFTIKVLTAGLFFLSCIQPVVSQISIQQNYLSIDQVIDKLENKYPVHFFYKPKWFENKNFQPSILRLSFNETLNQIKTIAEISVITIDSLLYIFIPVKPILKPVLKKESSNAIIVGNPDDYGKYARVGFYGKILDGKTGNPLPGASIFIDR